IWCGERPMNAGHTDEAAHLEQHSDIATVEGVSRAGIFAEWTGGKVHIAHESTRHSLPHIRFAKQRGVDMTVETCPQYLLLSTDDGARLGPNFLRVKPPVREPGHNGPLWEALLDGTIDIISTDHAPHLREELSADRLHSIGNATPYEGFEITGVPVRTMVRGKTVAKDGQPVGEPGCGRNVAQAQ